MKKITFMLMLLLCATVNAANTTKTVSQVTDGVALTTDVDYVITMKLRSLLPVVWIFRVPNMPFLSSRLPNPV